MSFTHFRKGGVFCLPVFVMCLAGAGRSQGTVKKYAGTQACQTCHQDIFDAFRKNPHAALEHEARRGWTQRACEACHGPGAKHAESMDAGDIRNPAKLPPAVTGEICLRCHLNTPTHAGRVRGGHARNQVSCVACHSMHRESRPLVVRASENINNLCSSCHQDIWAAFHRPHTHELTRGAMSCVDCHDPHGAFLPRNLRTVSANEPGCFRCHGDKRGPFVFEHAPLRLEGCTACHVPHGSANPRMLIRHEVSNLCLECHANIFAADGTSPTGTLGGVPPAFHDLRSRRFQNCTICHQKIHGSQASRDFLR